MHYCKTSAKLRKIAQKLVLLHSKYIYMGIISFLKKWTLPSSLLIGAVVYLLFVKIPFLVPSGNILGPIIVHIIPYVLFIMLYVTFCKIQIKDMRPRKWHFILQGIRIILSGILVFFISIVYDANLKLILEGVFICVICPTAAAAPVITEKLGGSIASLTIYTIIANIVTSIIIPLFFPLVEKNADLSFLTAFSMLLRRVLVVLVLPLCLALLTRKFAPSFAAKVKERKNLAFYLWGVNLSILSGITVANILKSTVSGWVLTLLLILPLFVTFMLFAIGKYVGKHYGDSISAGQALGQKNTAVGLWLTITFLNPVASVAPGVYAIWQNLFNAWQLWYKDKYGYLKW